MMYRVYISILSRSCRYLVWTWIVIKIVSWTSRIILRRSIIILKIWIMPRILRIWILTLLRMLIIIIRVARLIRSPWIIKSFWIIKLPFSTFLYGMAFIFTVSTDFLIIGIEYVCCVRILFCFETITCVMCVGLTIFTILI